MATGGSDPNDWMLVESNGGGFACRKCGFRSQESRATSENAHRIRSPNCRGGGGVLEPDAVGIRHSAQEIYRDQDRRSRDVEFGRQNYLSTGPVDLGYLAQKLTSLEEYNRVQQRSRDAELYRHSYGPSRPVDLDDLAQGLASLEVSSRAQQREKHSSNAVNRRQSANDATRLAQHLAPLMVGSTTQQSDEDILLQLRCSICLERWNNLVLLCCRHLICDVCFSKCSSKCGICRGTVSGRFPLRFHSMDMIGGINVPATLDNDERGNMQLVISMGYTRESVRRVIQSCASDGTTGPLTLNDILDKLELLQRQDGSYKDLVDSVYCFPTPEELELIPSASADKMKFSRWLQVAGKCLICRVRDPCICLFPCHHLAICFECNQGPRKPEFCPDRRCGRKIKNQVKVHL